MLDQGSYGTCVGNAWTHFLMHTSSDDKVLLDPDNQPSYAKLGSSAYWPNGYQSLPISGELYAVKLYDAIHDGVLEPKDPERNDGCYTEHGGVVLKRRGMIGGYYRAASVDDVIQALLTHGPVVFASPWYASMSSTKRLDDSTRRYVEVDPATTLRGYHAYLLDGVDLTLLGGEGAVRVHNSWGWGWGKAGIAWMPLSDLRTAYIQNAWIATEA